jgi:hypothetical protein
MRFCARLLASVFGRRRPQVRELPPAMHGYGSRYSSPSLDLHRPMVTTPLDLV